MPYLRAAPERLTVSPGPDAAAAAFDAAPAALVLLSREGGVLRCNAAAARLLGCGDAAGAEVGGGLAADFAELVRISPVTDFPLRRAGSGGGPALLASVSRVEGGGWVCALAEAEGRRGGRRAGDDQLMLEQLARARAETAERRAGLLAFASELLDSGFDYMHSDESPMLGSLAQLAVPTLADYCRVDLRGPDGTLRRVALAHSAPGPGDAPGDAEPGAAGNVVAQVAASGAPVLVSEVDADARARLLAPYGGLLSRARSLVVVPLSARAKTVGVLTLAVLESGRRFQREDLRLAQDLARRTALAVDNVRLYRRAEASSRRREEILGIVSHDLRGPLNVLSMGAGVLLRAASRRPEANEAEVRQLEVIVQAAGRMRRLIEDLLDVSQIDAGQLPVVPEPACVNDILRNAHDFYRPLAEEAGLALEVEMAPEALRVHADRDRVHQVLGNLIGNALRHTPAGGTIALGAEGSNGRVRFRVSDTGSGIEPEQLPRIFDRFWRGRGSPRTRAGLGLAIARGIVEAHGGGLGVESAVGEGSVFHFDLPSIP